MALTSGTKLGPYEVLAPIGAGGMGEVYKGRDTRLERTVAIKVLPAHLTSNPEVKQRFEREARAVSSLNHPHICALYDIGQQDGTDFLVMEYLEGETLAECLKRGPLPANQTLRCTVQVADALDKAHRQGVTHRDLKPANIMLTKSGAKLLDFGLAKLRTDPAPLGEGLTDVTAEPRKLTVEGTIVGTFQYMAPEQLEGKEADARSDIFAFGGVLYEMVTGKPAFAGNSNASLIAAILHSEPPPLNQLQPMTPPALERVVRTCLAKDPEERWQTAHDVKLQLQWIAEGGASSQVEAGVPVPAVSRGRNRELVAWGVAALLAVALVAVLLVASRRALPEALTARFSVSPPEMATFANNDHIALSPDGRRMAFTARADGTRMLWLRPLDSFAAQPLTGTEGAFYPFWSPDSRSIAFFAGGKLKKIELGSRNVETICDAENSGGGGTWNRDGVILFAPGVEGGLTRVSTAGGPLTPVTQLDPAHGETNHLWPHFLPDGRHYVFELVVRDN